MSEALMVRLLAGADRAVARRGSPPEALAVLAVLRAEHGTGGPTAEVETRVLELAAVLGLTELERDLLWVALAAECDDNVASLWSQLTGAAGSGLPTVGLATELVGESPLSAPCRVALGPSGALRRWGMLTLQGPGPHLRRQLLLPERVVGHLVGDDAPDPALRGLLVDVAGQDLAGGDVLARVLQAGAAFVYVQRPHGSAALSFVAGAVDQVGYRRLLLDVAPRSTAAAVPELVTLALREAALQRAVLVLIGLDDVVAADPSLVTVLAEHPVPVVAVGAVDWDAAWLPFVPYVARAPLPSADERLQMWRSLLPDAMDADPGVPTLAALRLPPEAARKVVAAAQLDSAAQERVLTVADLLEAARRQQPPGAGLLRAARVRPTFQDLVLPTAAMRLLQELVAWAQSREQVLAQGRLLGRGDKGRGIGALFTGSPGTGKTLAAQVVASELGLELSTVQLSGVVDKYIGETEKNLEKVFTQAENSDCVLFFDEADALFGSRSAVRDARDRYANQEVSYLLQRIEAFNGITILATNLRGNLDAAFSRRMQFIVHFPDPDGPTRRRLWDLHLGAVPRDPQDLPDLDELSRCDLAGGDVRNVVLAAAYAAAADGATLGMRHLRSAILRELLKLGRRTPAVPPNVP